ncbi:hypothetical protein [Sphingomonas sp.]|uniref:hypothetical protein n=1 Tax=Sphingomonas sp. TaxID=28214 RepID=UPI003AFF7590
MTFKILLATTALVAVPALAQTSSPSSAAQPAATGQAGTATGTATGGAVMQGAAVYDTQGGTVGTVESVNGDMVVLATQKSKVQLPKSSFASGPKGPVIAMTATQLDQAAAQASPAGATGSTGGAGAAAGASAKPAVAQGAAVSDTQGGAVGTVSDVDAQFATVTLTTGGKVRLPVGAFGAGTDGGLRVAMTAAQLSAAAGASGGGSSSATGATGTDSSGSASGTTKVAKGKKGH